MAPLTTKSLQILSGWWIIINHHDYYYYYFVSQEIVGILHLSSCEDCNYCISKLLNVSKNILRICYLSIFFPFKQPCILSFIRREHQVTPRSCSLISVINSVHVDDKRDAITASVCAHQSQCSSATHQHASFLCQCQGCSDASCLMRPIVTKRNGSYLA